MIWKIVNSAIGFKTMQLHLLFNIYVRKNHERKKLSGIFLVSGITRIAPSSVL